LVFWGRSFYQGHIRAFQSDKQINKPLRWAVSMTLLTTGGRCQWHCWPLVDDANDTADHWWAVSMTLLTTGGRCQWYRWPLVEGVNDTADHWWAVSMTLLTTGGRCQWHCWPLVGGVNDTVDHWWKVSMTLLTTGGRCQWYRWPLVSGSMTQAIKAEYMRLSYCWIFSPWIVVHWIAVQVGWIQNWIAFSGTKICDNWPGMIYQLQNFASNDSF
jgi:hypothetical protein